MLTEIHSFPLGHGCRPFWLISDPSVEPLERRITTKDEPCAAARIRRRLRPRLRRWCITVSCSITSRTSSHSNFVPSRRSCSRVLIGRSWRRIGGESGAIEGDLGAADQRVQVSEPVDDDQDGRDAGVSGGKVPARSMQIHTSSVSGCDVSRVTR